ncbi:MAG: NAD(P)-dependent oxidoreductase [Gemmatimonadota bacterium]
MSETVTRTRLGFIGLGLMGLPMCRNLLRAGLDLTVYNRTPAKAEPLAEAGAQVAESVPDLAERCDVLMACLATVAASEATFSGENGAINRSRPGQIYIDLGTTGPDVARRLGAALASKGVDFLDAPVSGGVEGAAAASLTIMVGGKREAFQRAEPILRVLGRNIHHLGDVGAGSVAKLVNQLLTLIHGAAATEAIALGVRAGADPTQLLDVIRTSYGQSKMLERAVPRIVAREFEAGAPLRLYAKDLGLIRELAEQGGVDVPLGVAVSGLLERAQSMGLADMDIAALYRLYETPRS